MKPRRGQQESSEDRLVKVQELITKKSGHALIAETLCRCGVRRVVGITGSPVDQIFPECAARGIRPIGTRHQHTAVLMAATSNYIAGRLESAVVVSAGPAVTNSLTGVLIARDNGWPVIVLGGRRPVHEQGIGYFQELDAVPIYQSVTKSAATVSRAADLPIAIVRAYEIAMNGRPGPVYLDLPEDVLDAQAETDLPAVPLVPAHYQADAHIVAECAQLLRAAERPLLILGEGIRWSFNEADLRDLVEQNGIPFMTTPLARGFLPDDSSALRERRATLGPVSGRSCAHVWGLVRLEISIRRRAGTECENHPRRH